MMNIAIVQQREQVLLQLLLPSYCNSFSLAEEEGHDDDDTGTECGRVYKLHKKSIKQRQMSRQRLTARLLRHERSTEAQRQVCRLSLGEAAQRNVTSLHQRRELGM